MPPPLSLRVQSIGRSSPAVGYRRMVLYQVQYSTVIAVLSCYAARVLTKWTFLECFCSCLRLLLILAARVLYSLGGRSWSASILFWFEIAAPRTQERSSFIRQKILKKLVLSYFTTTTLRLSLGQ